MSNPASFEEITTPSNPVEKWLADYGALLEAEVAEAITKLAETTDVNERDEQRESLKALEIARARLEHLDELAFICDPRFSEGQIIDELGKHVESLHKQQTSPENRLDTSGRNLPAFEEDKLKAKVVDTLSLRTVVRRQ